MEPFNQLAEQACFVQLRDTLHEALKLHDGVTYYHENRVSRYVYFLAQALELDERYAAQMSFAACFHDLGKVGVPTEILNKQTELDARDWGILRKHAIYGYNILAKIPAELGRVAATMALTHHERYDGKGYPQGLQGEEIPLVGRICSVCDVYDALRSDRPYRKGYSVGQTLDIMLDKMSSSFDPDILSTFAAHIEQFEDTIAAEVNYESSAFESFPI